MKRRSQLNLSLSKNKEKKTRIDENTENEDHRTKDADSITCDGDSGKKSRNILSWLKQPSNPPRTIACPACERTVLMSDINRHLDSDCTLYVTSKNTSVDCTIKDGRCATAETSGGTMPVDEKNVRQERDPSQNSFSEASDEEMVGALVGNPSHAEENGWVHQNQSDTKRVPLEFEECLCLAKEPPLETDGEEVFQVDAEIQKSAIQDLLAAKQTESAKNDVLESGATTKQEPYYLANFKFVLESVLSSEDDAKLFNSDDMYFIDAFNNLSTEGQKLYIRLFQRKPGWFRCSKLDYQRISQDLKPAIDLLKEKGFLDDERSLSDLSEILELTPGPDVKNLAKELHVSLKPALGKKSTTKESLVSALIHHSEKQRSLFGETGSVILKRAKQMLGPCVKVSKEPKAVFSRVILLFTMNMIPDDEDQSQAQQLSTLYLVNSARLVYPEYTIHRVTPVFRTRDELLRFSATSQEKHEMFTALEDKDFDTAIQYYPSAADALKRVLSDLDKSRSSGAASAPLPVHLRCFTAEYVLCKMCYLGVEILQKRRQYEEAVEQLELLLKQYVFCQESRGKWFDRLALNLHQHLKRPIKALEVIRRGLADPHVRAGRRLALIQRAKRIIASPTNQKKSKVALDNFGDMILMLVEPQAPKSVTISGTRSAQLGVFISNEAATNSGCTKTFCSVEEFALAYYRQQGYRHGIHGEGSTFTTLFGLLMWDVIFGGGIPDVFRGPFQSAPLDIFSDSFYENRKILFQERLTEIQSSSVEHLQELLTKSWSLHEGQICVGVSWDRFTGIDQAKELVSCFGGGFLAGVFRILAQGYRYRCSGIPDLVVWNSSTLEYKIVEVKGPGDRLSTKQQIWLEELSALGAQAEVCHVTAVGAKRLKVS